MLHPGTSPKNWLSLLYGTNTSASAKEPGHYIPIRRIRGRSFAQWRAQDDNVK